MTSVGTIPGIVRIVHKKLISIFLVFINISYVCIVHYIINKTVSGQGKYPKL